MSMSHPGPPGLSPGSVASSGVEALRQRFLRELPAVVSTRRHRRVAGCIVCSTCFCKSAAAVHRGFAASLIWEMLGLWRGHSSAVVPSHYPEVLGEVTHLQAPPMSEGSLNLVVDTLPLARHPVQRPRACSLRGHSTVVGAAAALPLDTGHPPVGRGLLARVC